MKTSVLMHQQEFEGACEAWLESRRPHLSPKTLHEYKLNLRTLTKFFGEFRLREITGDQIEMYQRMRLTQCGAPSINHECGVLQQMLKKIGRWDDIGHQYEPLPLPKVERGRALEPEERPKLWNLMRSSHHWDAVRLMLTISINSTASPGEVFTIRLTDVDMKAEKFWIGRSHRIHGAKNKRRVRRIGMNPESYQAFREALGRAKALGAYEPTHYLFPKRRRGYDFDPAQHQTTFRTAWDKIRAEGCRLGMDIQNLRMEDMRHTAVTMLYENENVADDTAENISGHKGEEMKRTYSHLRMQAQQKAIDALSAVPRKPVMNVDGNHAGQGGQGGQDGNLDNRQLAAALLAAAAKLLGSQ